MPILGPPPQLPQQRRSGPPPSITSTSPSSGALAGSGTIVGASVPLGVGAFTGSGTIAGTGAALAAGAGSLIGLASLAGVAAGGVFPLSKHASGRYLVQSNGTPFLVCADTTWSLAVNLPGAGITAFLNQIVSLGFNSVMMNAIEHNYTVVKPPKDVDGNLPFTQTMNGATYTGSPNGTGSASGTQAQFTADSYSNINNQAPDPTFINNTYWTRVETILTACLEHNVAVFVWPMYLGFHANQEGWASELVVWDAVTGAGGFTGAGFADPTKSKMWNYGAWLAARWASYPNIIWVAGGDYGSGGQSLSTPQLNAVTNCIAGMKSITSALSVMWSAHWDRPCISDDTTISGVTFDINFGYADDDTAELCRRAYNTAAKPAILGEYFYEAGLFGGSAPYRRYMYWGLLSAIGGSFFGHEQFWRFDDGTPGTDYTTLYGTQGTLDAQRQFALWTTLPWHRLKPSGLGGMGTIVTAGGGTASPQTTDYVSAACTPEGDLLLAYVPPAHTGTVTVDMTKMAGSARARWYDPTNAAFTALGVIANTGTHVFTTPGTNSGGDADFLLILDTPTGALTGSGTIAGVSSVLATGTGALTGSGTIAGVGRELAAGVGAFAGSGTIAGTGAALAAGTGSLAGSGTITGTGAELVAGVGALTGSGTIAGTSAATAAGAGILAGSGSIVGVSVAGTSAATLSGSGTIAGAGIALVVGSGAFTGSGTIAGTGAALAAGAGVFTGSGAIAGVGAGSPTGAGAFTASGTIAGTGAEFAIGVGTIAGSGTTAGAGAPLASGAGVLAGSGAILGAGVGLPAGSGVGAIAGLGTIAGVGVALASGVVSFSGSGSLGGASSGSAPLIIEPTSVPDNNQRMTTVRQTLSRFSALMSFDDLTAKYLLENYLTGFKFAGTDGQVLPSSWYDDKLANAIVTLESITGIDVLQRERTGERHDYHTNDYLNYAFTKLFHQPVQSVQQVRAVYPTGQVIQVFPPDWVRLDAEAGQIHLVPTSGSLAQVMLGGGNGYLPFIFAGLSYLPQLWEVDYVSGFSVDALPRDVAKVICKLAAIEIFTIMSDLVGPLGVASSSLGLDGMSQSIARQLPAFKARVDQYRVELGIPGPALGVDPKYGGGELAQLRRNYVGMVLASM